MRLRNRNRRPTHPGKLVRKIILPELGITQTELAKKLGVSRHVVSEFLNERCSLTPELANKLSRLVGRSPNAWLKMQVTVDTWVTGNVITKKYTRKKIAIA